MAPTLPRRFPLALVALAATLPAPASALEVAPSLTVLQTTTVLTEFSRGAVSDVRSATTPEYTWFYDDTNPFAPHPGAIAQETLSNPALFVEVEAPFGPAPLTATLSTSGATGVAVDAQLNDSLGLEPVILRAEVVQTSRNKFIAQAENLEFGFIIDDIKLELWDRFGVEGSPNPFVEPDAEAIGARVWYEVARDGEVKYRTQATVFGDRTKASGLLDFDQRVPGFDRNGESVDNIGLTGQFTSPDSVPRGYRPNDVDVSGAGASGLLDLGPLERGEFFEVVARMGVELRLPGGALGAGGRVALGDPNALGGFGLGVFRAELGQPAPTVPLPAAVWLLLAGLASLLGLRMKKAAPGGAA
jgi:hypothetical protein